MSLTPSLLAKIPLFLTLIKLGTQSKKENRKLWGFCPKFIDPLPSPLIGTKKLGLFAKLLDPLPPSGIWDITVTKLGSGNHIEDILNSF